LSFVVMARAGRLRALLWPTVLAACGLAVLLGLGTWQLERRAWKAGLIAHLQAAMAAPAVPLPATIADAAALEFRHVWVEGRFDHVHELYVTSRFYRDTPGYQVVTPLRRADGAAVLVNRGWVPLASQAPASRPAGQLDGAVRLEGVVRLSSVPGWFTPANEPGRNLWFYPDVAQMAAAAGLARVSPVFVEVGPAANPGGLPIGGQTRVDLPNDHLQYAITWYSLATALAVIYALFCHRYLTGDRPS
jgi:surfeit locus 1 family protein